MAGGGLAKPLLKAGKDPKLLTISTQQRKNHHVTLIGGLAAVGVSEEGLASELQVGKGKPVV